MFSILTISVRNVVVGGAIEKVESDSQVRLALVGCMCRRRGYFAFAGRTFDAKSEKDQ